MGNCGLSGTWIKRFRIFSFVRLSGPSHFTKVYNLYFIEPNGNNIIASGKLALHLIDKDILNDPFYKFDRESAHIVKMETVNVYMFCLKKNIEPFYIKTQWGYKFDQKIQTENLDLWKYNSVFFPDNCYFNSNALPIEWLEMFEKKETL